MKKSLLLSVGAMAVCGAAFAQDALQPAVYPEMMVTAISPNGRYMASSNGFYGVVTLIDNETGEMTFYYDENGIDAYSGGYGTWVSNNGIMVGAPTEGDEGAAWFENGETHMLPVQDVDQGVCISHAITPDGSRIVGNIGRAIWSLDTEAIMQQPVIWNRNAEGDGYDMYVELPYPTKDLFGQTPQYITAVCISDDGKTVAGQVMAFMGYFCYPIVFTEGEDGTWSYTIPNADIFCNPDVEIPANPGEAPESPSINDFMTPEELEAYNQAVEAYNDYTENEPKQTDFMTEEEIAEYNAAWDEYFQNPGNTFPTYAEFMTEEEQLAFQAAQDEYYDNMPSYPLKRDFMSAEELEAYEAADEAYEMAYADWYMAYAEFLDAIEMSMMDAPNILFNSLCLSGNGRYLALTDSSFDWWTYSSVSTPLILDLQDGAYYYMSEYDDMAATYVTNNGVVLGCSPIDFYSARNTYVCDDMAAGEFVAIQDYVQGVNAATYEWMKQNMVHSYQEEAWDYETEEVVVVSHDNEFCTGSSVATPDFKYAASYAFNVWYDPETEDAVEEEPAYFYSYLMPLNTTGLTVPVVANLTVKAMQGGIIAIQGAASSVAVYDLNGRQVYVNNAPSAFVATGLANGVYVVKATDAKGNVKIVKAAF